MQPLDYTTQLNKLKESVEKMGSDSIDIIDELTKAGFISSTTGLFRGTLSKSWRKDKQKLFIFLADLLVKRTNYLLEDTKLSVRRKFIEFNITKDDFKCLVPGCNHPRTFLNKEYGFSKYCDIKQLNTADKKIHKEFKDKELTRTLEQSIEEKYGVRNISMLDEIKKQKEETLYKNYGVRNPNDSAELQEKKKQTFIQKYGVDNISKADLIKEKKKQTSLKNYGSTNYLNSEHRKKHQQFYNEKIKATNRDRYGVDWFMQTPEFQEKSKATCRERYGYDSYSTSISFKVKILGIIRRQYEERRRKELQDIIKRVKDKLQLSMNTI